MSIRSSLHEYENLLSRIDACLQSVEQQVDEIQSAYLSSRSASIYERRRYIKEKIARITLELTEAALTRYERKRNEIEEDSVLRSSSSDIGVSNFRS